MRLLRFAQIRERTVHTVRCAIRHTDHRSQLHQCLITVSGTRARHRRLQFLLCQPLDLLRCNIPIAREQPRQHAQNIAVHRGTTLPACNRCDCSRRIRTDARQRQQRISVTRHTSVKFRTNGSRRLLQITGAGIISQSFPQLEQLFLRHLGKCLHGRKCPHKAFIVRDDRLHPRLLQHNLGNPNSIRILGTPPRQIPMSLLIPRAQTAQRLFYSFLLCHLTVRQE